MFNTSDLRNFYGSQNSYRFMGGVTFTDGVAFLMKNGAGWLCSDAMIVCAMVPKVKREEFVHIVAKPSKDGRCVVTYDDGNGKVLHTQKYDMCDLPCEVEFYYENRMFMLTTER
jgi:hypothetical protein